MANTPYRPFSGYIPWGEYVGNNPLVGAGNTFDPLSSEVDLKWGRRKRY